jgi:hypothetical protein
VRLWHCYLVATVLLIAGVMTVSALRVPECRAPKSELDRQVCAEL